MASQVEAQRGQRPGGGSAVGVQGKGQDPRAGGAKGALCRFSVPPFVSGGHPGGLPGGGGSTIHPHAFTQGAFAARDRRLHWQGLPVQLVSRSPGLDGWGGIEGLNPRILECRRGSNGAWRGRGTEDPGGSAYAPQTAGGTAAGPVGVLSAIGPW